MSVSLNTKGAMYRVCSLQLGLNISVLLPVIKKFYLRLTADKMHTFEVFTEKYLLPYGSNCYKTGSNTGATAPVLRLRSTEQILILKYVVK